MGLVRDRVLQVAAEIFVEQHYHDVTLQYIAMKASTTAGTIQCLFGGKNGLLNTLLCEQIWIELNSLIFSRWFMERELWSKFSRMTGKAILALWYSEIAHVSSNPLIRRTLSHKDGQKRVRRIVLSFAKN